MDYVYGSCVGREETTDTWKEKTVKKYLAHCETSFGVQKCKKYIYDGWKSKSGVRKCISVSITNPMNVVFDKEVDFKIKVSDTDGCGNNCLGKESYQ